MINGALDAITSDFELGTLLQGFVVAIALLGCAAGAFIAGRLADKLVPETKGMRLEDADTLLKRPASTVGA